MNVLVLQHIACEPPGVYEDLLVECGATLHRVELDEGEPIPDWQDFDALIAMGGPMSVNDEARLAWLNDEKRTIARAVRAGRPYWGVCLGAQLLAAALGATVYRGREPEVGLMTVELTDEASTDPVFAGMPRQLLTLQWHNETFDLPAGSVRLARSPLYSAQAFRWGPLAYGLQFHLEVSSGLAREWATVPTYAEDLERVLGCGSLSRLIEDLDSVGKSVNDHGLRMFQAWLALVSGSR